MAVEQITAFASGAGIEPVNSGLVPVSGYAPTSLFGGVGVERAPFSGTPYRGDVRAAATENVACSASTRAGAPCKGRAIKDGLCMAHAD